MNDETEYVTYNIFGYVFCICNWIHFKSNLPNTGTKCQALTSIRLTHSQYTTKIVRKKCYTTKYNNEVRQTISVYIKCQDEQHTISRRGGRRLLCRVLANSEQVSLLRKLVSDSGALTSAGSLFQRCGAKTEKNCDFDLDFCLLLVMAVPDAQLK